MKKVFGSMQPKIVPKKIGKFIFKPNFYFILFVPFHWSQSFTRFQYSPSNVYLRRNERFLFLIRLIFNIVITWSHGSYHPIPPILLSFVRKYLPFNSSLFILIIKITLIFALSLASKGIKTFLVYFSSECLFFIARNIISTAMLELKFANQYFAFTSRHLPIAIQCTRKFHVYSTQRKNQRLYRRLHEHTIFTHSFTTNTQWRHFTE